MTDLKKTPLSAVHETLGAKMVDFAGFFMPVAYGSIIEEHRAVRERVGMFDVSHMGEFFITGHGARAFVNRVITNDCSKLAPGALQYSVMCRDNGTVVDDLLIYVLGDDRILLIVNASNIDKDFAHICSLPRDDVEVTNASDDFGLIAVQGPRARDVLLECPLFSTVKTKLETTPYYHGFAFDHNGHEVLVSRTGYTGELGFEVFAPVAVTEDFWQAIAKAGAAYEIQPIGLGARDTLRFEASFCLYGHELDDNTSPLEAGLGWVVKLKKDTFVGIEALRNEKQNGSVRTLVGLELEGRNIARQGYEITANKHAAGSVTSGAFSPTLQKSLCMALVDKQVDGERATYDVLIRGRSVPTRRTKIPFYPSRAK